MADIEIIKKMIDEKYDKAIIKKTFYGEGILGLYKLQKEIDVYKSNIKENEKLNDNEEQIVNEYYARKYFILHNYIKNAGKKIKEIIRNENVEDQEIKLIFYNKGLKGLYELNETRHINNKIFKELENEYLDAKFVLDGLKDNIDETKITNLDPKVEKKVSDLTDSITETVFHPEVEQILDEKVENKDKVKVVMDGLKKDKQKKELEEIREKLYGNNEDNKKR